MGGFAKQLDDFAQGVGSVGQLFPAPIPYSDCPVAGSAWEGVAKSFRQAGKSLQFAMKECPDAERKRKPAR